ncbi:MAG: PKD domain-containing protein [Candidatus Bipolaricaulota bacterium]|nr:PKD domain-containing protein [Candidatus Bipolaricaulota bacterium]
MVLLVGLGILSGCLEQKPKNQPPQAQFSFSPLTPTVGDEVVFDASGSKDPDGQIVEYLWDFGDGSPTESGPTVIHVYSSPGQYTVKLTVTDDQGLSNSSEKTLTVVVSVVSAVKKSLAAPGQSPLGIAWDGSALWVVDTTDFETYKLYRVDPQTGSVLQSFDAPTIIPDALAWDGSRLWLIDGAESKLLQIDPANGKVLKTLAAPGTYPTGIAHDGSALWVADADELKIFQVNPVTGKVIDSFDAPSDFPQGLAWDGKYLWHLDTVTIYKLDPGDGTVVAEYEAPREQLVDLTWDGEHLWATEGEGKQLVQLGFEQ